MTAIEHAAAHPHVHGPLAHQFENLEQQRSSATLGMWTFLGTEVIKGIQQIPSCRILN